MNQARELTRRLALAALACGAAAGCGSTSGPVAIGTAGPFQEGYAQMVKRAVEMAVEEANADGGVNGAPIEVVARDDGGDGVRAAAIAQEFLDTPNLVAVVGHANSGGMAGAAPLYDHGLPAVIPSATSPALTGVSPWVFRVTTNDSTNGAMLARFAAAQGARRVAVLYENNVYGRDLAQAFRTAYPGTLAAMDPIPGDGSRVEPFVSYLRQIQPELVFVAGTELSGRALLREAERQGFQTQWLAGDGWAGLTGDTAIAEGVYMATPFAVTDPRPEAQRFVEAFRNKYGVTPDANAAMAYDATRLVVAALREEGASRRGVRAYLERVKGARAFPGVTGPVAFRDDHDPDRGGALIAQVRAGTLQPIEEGSR
ncbi:MAG TPA: ABC transporter substrate-binding protein [Longimicrobiaceae bacterium]|nr:ABC transporter substrate-binding protein [Longimicrobiaceae bacterium]